MKTLIRFSVFLLVFGLAPVWGFSAVASVPGENAKLAAAATHYEIAQLKLESGEYDAVLAEIQKILDLDFSAENEGVLTLSLLNLTEELLNADQHGLARQAVEASLKVVDQQENQFMLLMFKAKVFRDEGEIDAALETYRSAQKLVRHL
jgi:tetratricopeptide (TPR) repeat protein